MKEIHEPYYEYYAIESQYGNIIFSFIFVIYNNTEEERTSEMGATPASRSLVYWKMYAVRALKNALYFWRHFSCWT